MNVKKKNCFLLVVLSILLCLPFSLSLPAEAAYENTHVNTGDQATDLVEVQEHKLAIMREQTTIPSIMFGLAL